MSQDCAWRVRYHAALRCTKILDVDVKFPHAPPHVRQPLRNRPQSTHGALGAESGAPRVV